ncbi:MAG: hypothetical protein H6502_04270 [Candidatus Woesearchaeota archaeon]|nr:MAG: hypothetical protein H6502_04270 [Candidatus Woesearchaeota archaeon]
MIFLTNHLVITIVPEDLCTEESANESQTPKNHQGISWTIEQLRKWISSVNNSKLEVEKTKKYNLPSTEIYSLTIEEPLLLVYLRGSNVKKESGGSIDVEWQETNSLKATQTIIEFIKSLQKIRDMKFKVFSVLHNKFFTPEDFVNILSEKLKKF